MQSSQSSAAGKPIELNDSNFVQAIKQKPFVVVDFWANWCGPCKMMLPIFEQLPANCKRTDVGFATVHVVDPKAEKVKTAMRIDSLPTFVIFHNGKEAARKKGGMPREELTRWIDSVIGIPK